MITFIKIAWRNIARNKFRSLITITAVSAGLGALIFLRAFVQGGDYQMIENYTDLVSGHLQVHMQGFQKKMGLERSISNPADIEKIISSDPGVSSCAKRIKEYVLISSAEHSSGTLLEGIEPSREKTITSLHKHIRRGEFLSDGKNDQVVLGKELFEILQVELGEKVVIMAQAADGSLAAAAFRVCGVLDTGTEDIDKGLALITLKGAQDLFVLGDKISEVGIRLNDVYMVDKIAARLKKKIDTKTYEVLTWKEIAPMMMQWVEFDKAFIDIILLVVLFIAGAGILNTILMGVLERVREFGIMLALGTKRRQIVLMVSLESLFLGIIGVLVGVVLGVGISIYFGKQGVNLKGFATAFESYYIGSTIYPRLFIREVVSSAAVVLMTSVIVSVYPAWRAASLEPVDAIHHF